MIYKMRKYFSTHFAASFSAVLGIVFFIVVFSQQNYLKKEYLEYLFEQSYETENAVLSAIQQNMENSIKELLTVGAMMATDEELYELTLKTDCANDLNGKNNTMAVQLYRELQYYGYSNSVITVAILNKDGLLAQYDKKRISDSSLWDNGLDYIMEITEDFWGDERNETFPRYLVFTEPGIHPKGDRIFHIAYPFTGGKVSIWDTEYLLVLTYDLDVLKEFVTAINMPNVEYIRGYIVDEDGWIVYHEDENLIGAKETQLVDNGYHTNLVKEIECFGWSIGAVIDEGKVKEHVSEIYLRGSAIYLFLIVIGLMVVSIWFGKLIRPVKQLSESMKHVEQGNFHSKIKIEGEHEIWQIAEEYNRMIEAIQQKNHEIAVQHKEMLRSIKQQNQAEREALESQINAHFICNTLGCINYEAMEVGNHRVSILIKKLSNILRYSFDHKNQEVYIFQEIAWIDQYLYLQQCRMEGVFEYEVDFPEIYGQWPCCRLMFQPFVENSILHGFEGRKNGGVIRIYGEMEGERLKITIEDNGCGIEKSKELMLQEIVRNQDESCNGNTFCFETKKEKIEKTTRQSVGIKNVMARMRMYYGSRLEVFLETEYGKGTKFVFLIPIPEMFSGMEEEEI